MNALRRKYKDLCEKEGRIRLELSNAREGYMKPREEVLSWLQNVENIQNQVESIETSAKEKSISFYLRLKLSVLVNKATESVDLLVRQSNFKDGLVVIDDAQFRPLASTLVGTSAQKNLRKIWVNLMDPKVGVLGIFGKGGVGKTTTVMSIKNLLAASSVFNSNFMDALRTKYEDLCEKEALIRLELSNAREQYMKPTEEVLSWLQNVENIQNQVESIETSAKEKRISCYLRLKLSALVEEATKAIDHLVQQCNFADGLVVIDEAQFPLLASTLGGTSAQENLRKIWVNLMDPKVGVLGIFGKGGVGKTSIMTSVKNLLVASSVFDKVLWVTISKEWNDWNYYGKIQNEIASQLNLDLRMSEYQSRESISHQAAKLLQRLKKIKKFVIIFDDIWKGFSLAEVGIPQPSGKDGRKIVLISRKWEVCHKIKSGKLIGVHPLDPDEAWDLFVSKAGNIVNTPDIEPFAKCVVRTCHGLPIFIVSVGLALKDEASIEAWRKALEELPAPNAWGHDIALDLLQFSYNRLRTDRMKNCFLYCAFFHEDYLFKPDELIRYWMAEGFIHKDSDIVTEIDDGLKILKSLVDANMLEIFTKNGDERVKMHDLFRHVAIDIMGRNESDVWHRANGLFSGLTSRIQPFATKVSMTSHGIERLHYPTDCSNLSTLLLRDNPIPHISSSFFTQILALNFLDISYSQIRELPPSLSELTQLRVLFLQYCTPLEIIPSLEKMKNLQVLNLCGTSIAELPQGMERLASLRSLDLSETTKLVNVRAGVISSLTRLEELRIQGCGLCRMDTPIAANFLMEMRRLSCLASLTISSARYADLLDTIVCLQEQNLKIYNINAYGSTEDYNENTEAM